ncbi:MAG: hypothetical protein HYV97_05700 [Bdellovibrio sp.]|nr:hypothetical protein [Bdellovibrio sp.]
MKKAFVVIIVTLLSGSAFAMSCNESIDILSAQAGSAGGLKMALVHESAKLDVLKKIKETFDENPGIDVLMGTYRSEIDKELAYSIKNVQELRNDVAESIEWTNSAKSLAKKLCKLKS